MGKDNASGLTSKQVSPPNPKGKGGFGDNPQNRSNGSWKKTETFRYWYGIFKDMSVTELKYWQENNPEETRSVASDLAFTRVVNAKKDLKEFQEVANRSEGMPIQSTDVNLTGQKILVIPSEILEKYKIAHEEINDSTAPNTKDSSTR